eukprot:scaffold83197_cov18-Tisochrysis_lutea.AAC.2
MFGISLEGMSEKEGPKDLLLDSFKPPTTRHSIAAGKVAGSSKRKNIWEACTCAYFAAACRFSSALEEEQKHKRKPGSPQAIECYIVGADPPGVYSLSACESANFRAALEYSVKPPCQAE